MNLTWRKADPSDLGLLAEWNYQLIQDEGHQNRMTVAELATRMREWLANEYRAVLFTSNDEPVVYALYRPDPASIYLRQFFVRRDRRRLGFGRDAIALLRREVWPRNVRLTLDVLCHNHAGIAFWRSVGYRDYCLTLEIQPPACS